MAKRLLFSTLLLSALPFSFFAQQLLINEVSQGPSGSKEYVEFVVYGTTSGCSGTGTSDLRGVVMDDNNGLFQSGSGAGVAQGAVRFANISFWSAVPYGTIIVIYNDNEVNPNLPANDASLSDGNNRLIIPASSSLLEGTTVSPSSGGSSSYPTAATDWTIGAGNWSTLGMANGGDSFQTRTSVTAAGPYSSVSWGTNSSNTQQYFSGAASGKVFYQSGEGTWSSGSAPNDETPGVANDAANANFISSLQSGTGSGITVNLTPTAETCGGTCDGQISASVSGGSAPYTYSWTGNGSATPTISSLCPGSYTVTVTDANGCTQTGQTTVNTGAAAGDATITQAGPFPDNAPSVQLHAATAGGTWVSTCGTCLSSTGVFSPAIAGVGTWQICYSVGSGSCMDNDCINITVTNGCVPQNTYDTVTVCPGTSVLINGNQHNQPGIYASAFTDINGCDSTSHVLLANYSLPVVDTTVELCMGDTAVIFGNFMLTGGTITDPRISADGCSYEATATIHLVDCDFTEPTVYIPNVFTPNGDGVNDIFEIVTTESYINEGYIFNRWGNTISELSNDVNFWNGKDKNAGKDVPDGVYTYIVTITGNDNSKKQYQGFVTLLR